MKRIAIWSLLSVVVLGLSMPAFGAGNGAPSGTHYNLNILGKNTCPGDDLVGTNRHTIMVKLNYNDGSQAGQPAPLLDKTNKIYLQVGDFQVIDGNACDTGGAKFQLPANPFGGTLDDPTFQNYLVYARALGKPGGSARMTTCATDPGADLIFGTADDEIVCSTENVLLVRAKGKSTFSNVTRELTTLCLNTDTEPGCDTRVGIFDASLEDYFWDYDNTGLRLAQLRFYPIAD